MATKAQASRSRKPRQAPKSEVHLSVQTPWPDEAPALAEAARVFDKTAGLRAPGPGLYRVRAAANERRRRRAAAL